MARPQGPTGLLAGAFLVLGGCTSAGSVTFNNMSDTWLNVSFYVMELPRPAAAPEAGAEGGEMAAAPAAEGPAMTGSSGKRFVAQERLQIEPGKSERYKLTKNPQYRKSLEQLVHVRVQPVNPSWEATGSEYWLELLSQPPMTIVAIKADQGLKFMSGDGALAQIPKDQVGSRFQHRMATVSETKASEPMK